jgi:hypothetical protein
MISVRVSATRDCYPPRPQGNESAIAPQPEPRFLVKRLLLQRE